MSSSTFNYDRTFMPSSSIGYKGSTSYTPTASSGTKVGNYLRSESGQQNVSALIGGLLNFGLTAFGSNQQRQDLKAQANIVARQGQDALSVEEQRTQQALIRLEEAKLQGAGAGGNMALYIGLGIAGVVVLGVVIFAVTRRSNA